MNLFTNVITLVFYFFTRYAHKRFVDITDPSTGEKLTEKNKKFEIKKVVELPWVFWAIIAFSWLYVNPGFWHTDINSTQRNKHSRDFHTKCY